MIQNIEKAAPNYNAIIGDLVGSIKGLVKNNFVTFEKELKSSFSKIQKHVLQLVVLNILMIIASLPLLFAAVWGLGVLLGGRFWLSALLIGAVSMAILGYLVWRTQKKLKADFNMEMVEKNLQATSKSLLHAVTEIKDAIEGRQL